MLLGRLKLWYNFKAAVTYIADTVQMSLCVYLKKNLCVKFLLTKCKNPPLVNIYTYTYISERNQIRTNILQKAPKAQ